MTFGVGQESSQAINSAINGINMSNHIRDDRKEKAHTMADSISANIPTESYSLNLGTQSVSLGGNIFVPGYKILNRADFDVLNSIYRATKVSVNIMKARKYIPDLEGNDLVAVKSCLDGQLESNFKFEIAIME